MKVRAGFVSNSSSSSFVIKKKCMDKDDIKEFYEWMEKADYYETIGETDNFFFGIIDYSGEFYKYVDGKNFKEAEMT